jgi:hypothetical protein
MLRLQHCTSKADLIYNALRKSHAECSTAQSHDTHLAGVVVGAGLQAVAVAALDHLQAAAFMPFGNVVVDTLAIQQLVLILVAAALQCCALHARNSGG